MGIFLAIALVAWLAGKAVSDGKLDHNYAKQGLVSPRLQARYGTTDRSSGLLPKYGLANHVRDAWRDYWPRRTQALVAARDARAAGGGPPRMRDRFATAQRSVLAAVSKKPERPAGAPEFPPADLSKLPNREPVEIHRDEPKEQANKVDDAKTSLESIVEPKRESPVPPANANEIKNAIDKQIPTRPERTFEKSAVRFVATIPEQKQQNSFSGHDDFDVAASRRFAAGIKAERKAKEDEIKKEYLRFNLNKYFGYELGTTKMATGEAVNYETAINELQLIIQDLQKQVDSASAALQSIRGTKAAVDNMQQTYAQIASAAQVKLEYQTALNLDATTLGHASAIADCLPPNAVDALYDQLDMMEKLIEDLLNQSATALAAAQAELAHLVATYGDAFALVSSSLSGDSRFLDAAGQGATPANQGSAPTPTPTSTPASSAPPAYGDTPQPAPYTPASQDLVDAPTPASSAAATDAYVNAPQAVPATTQSAPAASTD